MFWNLLKVVRKMKNKLSLILLLSILLFSCAATLPAQSEPTPTPTPDVQTDCSVCINLYVAHGHNFIQIIDHENNLVCWEDAGYFVQLGGYGYNSYPPVVTSYAPVLNCVKQ